MAKRVTLRKVNFSDRQEGDSANGGLVARVSCDADFSNGKLRRTLKSDAHGSPVLVESWRLRGDNASAEDIRP